MANTTSTNVPMTFIALSCWLFAGGAACSSSDDAPATPSATSGSTDPAKNPDGNGTADLPATGATAEVRAWLAKGDYKTGTWKCEPAPHAARSPSPHGMNRICSNATLSAHGEGEFPVGSAAVKELFGDDGKIIGHAIYRKVAPGGGASFYWWEDMNGTEAANGMGDTGTAKSICVGCHAGAGSDAMHSGHDQVYTQVR